jgi:uncharacterized protein (TIGR02145 family)
MPSSSSSVVTGGGLCDGFTEGTTRAHYGKNKAQFCDIRDGKKYVYVTIDSQIWMAENLNYAGSGSKCGDGSSLSDENTSTCDTYGRLYDWATANTVCPSGWHLPSDAEWGTLMKFVDPSCSRIGTCDNAGKLLKATSGWDSNEGKSGNGTDDYGFSALPGGYGYFGGNFDCVGDCGYWWSATEYNASVAYLRGMEYSNATVVRYGNDKTKLYYVRCVKD